VAQAAFAALPSTVTEYYYRGDSACHEHALIDWLRDPARANGPRGLIQFAVSARMSPALRAAVEQVPEAAWLPYGTEHPNEVRDCAEVDFVPRSSPSGRRRPRCAMWRSGFGSARASSSMTAR